MKVLKRTEVQMGAVLAALMAAGAFWDGLYAPGQHLLAVGVLACASLVMHVRVRLSKWEWAAVLFVLGGAAISLWRAASPGVAVHGPVLAAGWLLALMVGRQVAGRAERALGHALALTSALMLFGGLAAISYLPAHHSGRLASFLGYPNAVGILGLLGFACSLPSGRPGRWWRGSLACTGALAVFLSGSRGVWGAGMLLAGYLLWAASGLLRRGLAPAAWGFAAALWAGPAVAAGQRAPALAAAAAGVVGALLTDWAAALVHAVRTDAPPEAQTPRAAAWRRWVPLLPGALWILALAAAPGWGWFLGRAGALPLTEGSSVERWVILQDGLRLARDLPWGAGLKGWAALHLQHASYGYYAAEVHSAPLELAISFGWAAAAGFMLLLARFWWGLREGQTWPEERTALLGGLGALGIHALLDWDLSYGFFMLLLWVGFGLVEDSPPAQDGAGSPEHDARPAAGGHFWPTVVLATGALLGVLVVGAGDLFTDLAGRSLAAGDAAAARQHAEVAVAVAPWNDQGHAALGQALAQAGEHEAAAAAFGRARRLAPYEPWYAELLGRELMAGGHLSAAAEAYRALPALWPWHVPAYERALDAHLTMLIQAEWQGDDRLAAEIRQSGRTILEALDRQKAREPAGMPRAPMELNTQTIRRAQEALDRL